MKHMNGEETFFRGCCHAGLSGLSVQRGSGVSAKEGSDQAQSAIDWVRRAVFAGYTNPDAYRYESALDPVRDRPEFKKVMTDLKKPVESAQK